MTQTYFGVLTAIGEAKDAQAKALGVPLVFTHMAVGDANGVLPVPDRTRTTLIHEQRRALLNQLSRDPINTNQVIAEQVIPESVGGWWVRELGLFDEDGDLIAYANCPETYKPQLVEGSGRTQVVRMVLLISSADTVQLKVDPSIVLATRKYADDAIVVAVNAHTTATDPHTQYVLKQRGIADYDATKIYAVSARVIGNDGKTYKSLQAANTNRTPSISPLWWEPWGHTQGELLAIIQARLDALVDASPEALNTLKELATALGNDANFSATITNELALKAPLSAFASLLGSGVATPGWQKLPGGLIIQWGAYSFSDVPSGTSYTNTFNLPIAFPNVFFGGIANVYAAAYGLTSATAGMSALNLSQYQGSVRNNATMSSLACNFIAIGK